MIHSYCEHADVTNKENVQHHYDQLQNVQHHTVMLAVFPLESKKRAYTLTSWPRILDAHSLLTVIQLTILDISDTWAET